jgi:hypothetical protein
MGLGAILMLRGNSEKDQETLNINAI